jgi:arylsulfatase A-like enzyme
MKGGQAPPHEYLYWDYGHTRGQYKQAVRLGDWKAVRNGTDQPIELYDVRYNASETQNVAAKHPEVLAQIEKILATASTPDPRYPIAPPKKTK